MVVILTIQYRAANLKRCDAYAVEFFRIFEHMQFRNRLQGVVYVRVRTGDGGSMLVSIVGWHAAAWWVRIHRSTVHVQGRCQELRHGHGLASSSLDDAEAVMCRCGQAVLSSVCFPSFSMGRGEIYHFVWFCLNVCSSPDCEISNGKDVKVEAWRARLQKGLWRKKAWSHAARMYRVWFILILYVCFFAACWSLFLLILGDLPASC